MSLYFDKGANRSLSNLDAEGEEKLVSAASTEIGNRERKDISSLVANGTLSQAVAEQNLEKYGIHIGDYFTGASGYTYTVADMDTFYGGYNNNAAVNTHHVCLVVDTKHNEPWNYSTTLTANSVTFTYDSAGEGYYAWKNGTDYVYTSMRQPNPNSDKAYSDTTLETEYATITAVNNFTDGGYVASQLHSYLVGTALPKVQTDLGNHLVKHGKMYSNAMVSNRYNRTGQNSGASSNWAWSSDQYISALTEAQVYGTIIWSSSGNDTGEAFKQLDVFRKFRANQIFGNTGVWLRDIVSSSSSARLFNHGNADNTNTLYSLRGVGLIMYY